MLFGEECVQSVSVSVTISNIERKKDLFFFDSHQNPCTIISNEGELCARNPFLNMSLESNPTSDALLRFLELFILNCFRFESRFCSQIWGLSIGIKKKHFMQYQFVGYVEKKYIFFYKFRGQVLLLNTGCRDDIFGLSIYSVEKLGLFIASPHFTQYT